MLKRREILARKFIDGDWGVELKCFEAGLAADQQTDVRHGSVSLLQQEP